MLDPNALELEIIPGINETDWDEIQKKIELVAPFAKTIHIDLEDGKLVDRKTFLDPKPFQKYTNDVLFELHMMVENPLEYLKPFADVGFKRFLGHVEKMPDQVEFVALAQGLGDVGLALDGPTETSIITVSFDDLDSVLVYTSDRIGPSGPPLLDSRLQKVKHIRDSCGLPIEVDGGINDKTILKAKEAGATRFVSTSYIFSNEKPEKAYHTLQKLVGL